MIKANWDILFKSKNWTGWKNLMTVYDRTEKEAIEAAKKSLFYYCGTYDWMIVRSYKKLTKPNASDIIQNMKESLWSPGLQSKIDALKIQGDELLKHSREIKNRNMKTTDTQLIKNINKSAEEIVNLIENLGFVTDTPVLDLELQISYILQRNLQMDNFINPAKDRVTIADKITISTADLDSWNRDEMGG